MRKYHGNLNDDKDGGTSSPENNAKTFEPKLNPNTPSFSDKYIEGNSEESKVVYSQIDTVGPTNYCVII